MGPSRSDGDAQARYDEAAAATRQFRATRMMKRGARGNEVSGVDGTADGELAMACPACPQPGKNLEDGWEEASDRKVSRSVADVHVLTVSLDGSML